MINETPRVRFAPSPTGYLHVGGLRTALYNYLFVKKNNGKFILRIEDTDRNRYVEGAVDNLIETIKWTGLIYDEGPDKEGDYGPYYQSQRLEIYNKYADQLIEEGKAYYCFCTPERIQKLREEQHAKKEQAKYDKHCLNLSKEEITAKLEAGEKHVIRLNVPLGEKIHVNDIVRGKVEFTSDIVDDQILIKGDGYPTYHLANVVDDHLMKITHVIRGEEWLSSTPKHVLLYNFLKWELPEFAHLPLLLNPDKSKLSKRQGDVAVEDYKAKGYLKEALVNFVALLGWNAGDDKEFYELEDLINSFLLERVNKSGAVFNVEKLNWLNGEHLRNKNNSEIVNELKILLENSEYKEFSSKDNMLLKIVEVMKERIIFVKDIIDTASYFFAPPKEYDQKTISKRWKPESNKYLQILLDKYEQLENPTKEDYETILKQTLEELEIGMGKLMLPLRLAVSGVGGGPHVYDILDIIGKEQILNRIKTAIEKIKAE
ncbi:MAG: glutamate--tRNA ligase [Ignavibacteria bacterium]|jgi:glutamyl-tRNA synthetase